MSHYSKSVQALYDSQEGISQEIRELEDQIDHINRRLEELEEIGRTCGCCESSEINRFDLRPWCEYCFAELVEGDESLSGYRWEVTAWSAGQRTEEKVVVADIA